MQCAALTAQSDRIPTQERRSSEGRGTLRPDPTAKTSATEKMSELALDFSMKRQVKLECEVKPAESSSTSESKKKCDKLQTSKSVDSKMVARRKQPLLALASYPVFHTGVAPSMALTSLYRRRRRCYSNDGGKDSPTKKNNSSGSNSEKDDAYWERRRKNNQAAKRSRDARKMKEDEIALRAAFLEQENCKLKAEVAVLKTEMARMHCLLLNQMQP